MSQALFEPGEIAPHSQQAEEAGIGSVLINPDAFHEVAGIITSHDFFILRNGWIWEAMERLAQRGEQIEYLTVIEELRVQKRLDDVGGAAYITYLASNTATAVHAEAYARIIERAAIRRRLLETAGEITELARAEDADINEVLDRAESALFDVLDRAPSYERPASEAREELVSYVRGVQSDTVDVKVTPTHTVVDKLLTGGGLESGLWILTADTSGHKTNVLINFLTNMALAGGHVSLHSLEMSDVKILRRILARFSGIGSSDLFSGEFSNIDAVDAGAAKLMEIEDRLHIVDNPAVSLREVMSTIRKHVRDYNIVAAGVDYLGLIDWSSMDTRGMKEYQILGAMALRLKQLSGKLNIPIIVPVQQNRGGGGLHAIAGSYLITNHADGVLYIYDHNKGDDNDTTLPFLSSDIVTRRIRADKLRDGRQWGHVDVKINASTHTLSEA